jgi:23S rRNA (adenine2030-N6)-methyltransferase
VDTHAGAGCYDLQKQKNREYAAGIERLWRRKDIPAPLSKYIHMVQQLNPAGELRNYPGSPWLVQQLMGNKDRAYLFELHDDEIKTLQMLFNTSSNIDIVHTDGLQALPSLLSPRQNQVLILIDPAYKMKRDYVLAANALKDAYQCYAKGLYMVWYPVIERAQTQGLENELRSSGIENILQAELTVTPPSAPGMTGSGIIVINPPASLQENLRQILPYLAERLNQVHHGSYSNAWRIV